MRDAGLPDQARSDRLQLQDCQDRFGQYASPIAKASGGTRPRGSAETRGRSALVKGWKVRTPFQRMTESEPGTRSRDTEEVVPCLGPNRFDVKEVAIRRQT